jgi:hypothetical protein
MVDFYHGLKLEFSIPNSRLFGIIIRMIRVVTNSNQKNYNAILIMD